MRQRRYVSICGQSPANRIEYDYEERYRNFGLRDVTFSKFQMPVSESFARVINPPARCFPRVTKLSLHESLRDTESVFSVGMFFEIPHSLLFSNRS